VHYKFVILLSVVAICCGCDSDSNIAPGPGSPANAPANNAQNVTTAADPVPESQGGGDDSSLSPIRFEDVPATSGIDFVHFSGDNEQKPFPAANGSGIAVTDFDADGQADILFLNGAAFPIEPDVANSPAAPSDQAFRGRGGLKFTNVTAETGLGLTRFSAGVSVADFNSDGFPDIAVSCFGPNELFVNQGDGTFSRAGHTSDVDDDAWGTSLAWFDFDDDGFVDLYVCNYAEWSWETNAWCGNREANVRIFCAPHSVKPVSDRLFHNQQDGRFVDVLEDVGMGREPGRGQGVIAADLDNDTLIDLYVANDANPNFHFRNTGDGRFEDLTEISGTAHDYVGRVQAGMGVDVGDIDHDGSNEIFVTNYEDEHNVLYVNRQDSFFHDAGQASGLAAPSLRWVGWGTRLADFDLDGWLDLIVTNGHTDSNLTKMGRDAPFEQPPLLFRNRHGKMVLIPPEMAGDYFAGKHVGRSLCTGDLDGDLDVDVVVGHQDREPAVLKNVSHRAVGMLTLKLKMIGRFANRDGIGVHITVNSPQNTVLTQMNCGGSYLAAHASELVVSLPRGTKEKLLIRWPGGRVDTVDSATDSGSFAVIEGRGMFRLPDSLRPAEEGRSTDD
jgi:enediyne biosynthesis protein E4